MGIKSNFINNFNIMLIIFYLYVITTFITVILSKNRKNKLKKNIYQTVIKLFKQGLVTLVIFNCYNISFSTATHFTYAKKTEDKFYIVGSFAAIITFLFFIVTIIYLEFAKK